MTRAVAVIGSNMGSGRLFSLMILLESFAKLDVFQEDWFESSGNIDTSRKASHKMLFGLYFFHALIQVGQLSNTLLWPFLFTPCQERCNYGPLSWNVPYQCLRSIDPLSLEDESGLTG